MRLLRVPELQFVEELLLKLLVEIAKSELDLDVARQVAPVEVAFIELRQVDFEDLAERSDQVTPARAWFAYEKDMSARRYLELVESAVVVDGAVQYAHVSLPAGY